MDRVKQAADLALTGINEAMLAITKLPIAGSERNALSVTLMRASMDHGRALTLLLSIHSDDFGSSAVALHRAQLEALLRGAFFARDATDEELAYFIKEDEMPSRPDEKGKLRRLNPKILAGLAGGVLQVGDSKKLIRMVDNTWSVLCAMVHGGMAVVKTYNHAELAFHIEPHELVEIVGNTLGLAQLAFVGIASVSTVNKIQFDELARGPWDAQRGYHEFVKANFPKGVLPR
jgi:hypothetical protein